MADQISISLSETRVGIAAGAPPVVIEITVANRQQVVDEFVLTVSGGQPDWYDLSRDKVPLFPGESAKVTLRLHPPQRWDVQAGDTTLTVTAQSRADAALYSQAGVVVSITPTGGFEADLTRSEATGNEGVFVLRLANQSNAPMSYSITASDAGGVLDYVIPEQNLTLTPFQDRDHIEITARRKDPKTTGDRVVRFVVSVQPVAAGLGTPAQPGQRVDGTLLPGPAPVKPALPPWLKYALPAVALVLIGGGIGFALSSSSSGDEARAPVANLTPGQTPPTPIPTSKPGVTPTRPPATLVGACVPISRCVLVTQVPITVKTADTVTNICQANKPSNLSVSQCVQFVIEENKGISLDTKISSGQTIKLPK